MDDFYRTFLQPVLAWGPVREVSHGLWKALALGTGCFIIIAYFQHRAGKSLSAYASRHFVTDLLYRVAFIVYLALLYNPLLALVRRAVPALDQDVLSRQPLWLSLPVYWLAMDLLSYWVHRLQHSRVWWRFHRVHHSQEKMTFASGYRNHPIDQMFAHALFLVPSLLLGAPVFAWVPYSFLLTFIDATHHSALSWRFGPLRKFFVSPVFHAAHHSTDAAAYNRNYGGLLSIWDFMFGTAYDAEQLPERTGVTGWRVRESWWAHLWSPFRRGSVVDE